MFAPSFIVVSCDTRLCAATTRKCVLARMQPVSVCHALSPRPKYNDRQSRTKKQRTKVFADRLNNRVARFTTRRCHQVRTIFRRALEKKRWRTMVCAAPEPMKQRYHAIDRNHVDLLELWRSSRRSIHGKSSVLAIDSIDQLRSLGSANA